MPLQESPATMPGGRWHEVFALDVRSLALFRIGLGLLLLADLGQRVLDLNAHYTDAGRTSPIRASGVYPHDGDRVVVEPAHARRIDRVQGRFVRSLGHRRPCTPDRLPYPSRRAQRPNRRFHYNCTGGRIDLASRERERPECLTTPVAH